MLMKDLEGTKIKVRSRLYQQLLFAFLNTKKRDNVYKSSMIKYSDGWWHAMMALKLLNDEERNER